MPFTVYTAKNIAFLPNNHCHWIRLKIVMLIPFPVLLQSVGVRPPVLKLSLWPYEHRLVWTCSHFLSLIPIQGLITLIRFTCLLVSRTSPPTLRGDHCFAVFLLFGFGPLTCFGPLARCWPPPAFPVSPLLCFFQPEWVHRPYKTVCTQVILLRSAVSLLCICESWCTWACAGSRLVWFWLINRVTHRFCSVLIPDSELGLVQTWNSDLKGHLLWCWRSHSLKIPRWNGTHHVGMLITLSRAAWGIS